MPVDLGAMKPIHCFCSRSPLLAKFGVDSRGQLYVHMKVFKQGRVFGESIHRGGEVSIKCRECLRWYTITFKDSAPIIFQTDTPEELENEHEFDVVKLATD